VDTDDASSPKAIQHVNVTLASMAHLAIAWTHLSRVVNTLSVLAEDSVSSIQTLVKDFVNVKVVTRGKIAVTQRLVLRAHMECVWAMVKT